MYYCKEEKVMTGKEAKEKLKKQYDYRNEYTKQNYDRVSVTLPKGLKDEIRKYSDSVNGFIVSAVLDRLKLEKKNSKDNVGELPFS